MKKTIFLLVTLLLFLAILLPANTPSRSESRPNAVPPLPFPVIGTVKYNGFYLPPNGEVLAHCGTYTQGPATIEIADGKSWYWMNIQGDDPDTENKEGCELGEAINFTIQGDTAEQSTTWQEVTGNFLLDISFGSASHVFLPMIRR